MATTLEQPTNDPAPATATAPEPSFSVVIPTYNRRELAVRAIESCLAQTRRPEEIIVVDDGSTDGTVEALQPYRDRITYIHQENGGCSAARNRGVADAGADWIAFLDSDDTWEPGHLEAMAEALVSTQADADFYFGDSTFPHDGDGPSSLWDAADFAIEGAHRRVADGTNWVLLPRQPMKLQCSVFRREAYLRAGGLLEELRTREDTHFFLRMGIGKPICAVRAGGVRITYDDEPGNRLTVAYPADGRVYLEATVRLYGDVVAKVECKRPHRRELKRRLGAARLRLAKLDWRERKLGALLANLLTGVATCPANFFRAVGRRLRRLLP